MKKQPSGWEKYDGMSRREFLKDAGIVIGGASIGTLFLSSCGKVKSAVNSIIGTPKISTQITPNTNIGGVRVSSYSLECDTFKMTFGAHGQFIEDIEFHPTGSSVQV